MTRTAWVLAFLLVASLACGGGGGDSARLRVFAAASLGEALEEIGDSFEASHEGVQVGFSFAGS